MRISDWSSDVCSSDLLRAVRGDDARDGGFTDAVEPRHLGTGLAAGRDGLGDFAALLVAELGPTPADPSFCASLGKAGAGTLADHGPLELGEASHHLHHHPPCRGGGVDRLGRSEEHTSELQSLMRPSYAVFCLKKKKQDQTTHETSRE